jgi:hypothetical protein
MIALARTSGTTDHLPPSPEARARHAAASSERPNARMLGDALHEVREFKAQLLACTLDPRVIVFGEEIPR